MKDVDAPGRLRKVGPSLRHLDSKVDYTLALQLDSQAVRLPSDDADAAVLRPLPSILNDEAKDFTITGADGNPVEVTDLEYTAAVRRHRDSRAHAVPARQQPAVRVSRSARRHHRSAVGRARQVAVRIARLPGLPLAQRLPRHRLDARARPVARRREVQHRQGPALALQLGAAAESLSLADGDARTCSSSRSPKSTPPASRPARSPIRPPTSPRSCCRVPADWQPTDAPAGPELTADEERALADLTAVWLSASFPKRLAATYARRKASPIAWPDTVKVDERGLLAAEHDAGQSHAAAARLRGQALAEPLRLLRLPRHSRLRRRQADRHAAGQLGPQGRVAAGVREHRRVPGDARHRSRIGSRTALHGGTRRRSRPRPRSARLRSRRPASSCSRSTGHQRQGFLWQKLREPRSFDYATTKTKRYDERLRMPLFPFNAEEREQVMTFVLGLTSEPPAEQYIYNPGPRRAGDRPGPPRARQVQLRAAATSSTWSAGSSPSSRTCSKSRRK